MFVDRVGIYVDAGLLPEVAGAGDPGLAFVVAGAEVRTVGRLWLFLETNTELGLPVVDAGSLVNFVTPGVYATFDEAGDSELCVGVRLPTTTGVKASTFGVWFNRNVSFGR